MFGGLGTLIYFSALLVNAVAILSEDRFLARIGWTSSPQAQAAAAQGFGGGGDMYGQPDIGVKARLINLISAVRTLLRLPLIVVNIAIILYELPFGQ